MCVIIAKNFILSAVNYFGEKYYMSVGNCVPALIANPS